MSKVFSINQIEATYNVNRRRMIFIIAAKSSTFAKVASYDNVVKYLQTFMYEYRHYTESIIMRRANSIPEYSMESEKLY